MGKLQEVENPMSGDHVGETNSRTFCHLKIFYISLQVSLFSYTPLESTLFDLFGQLRLFELFERQIPTNSVHFNPKCVEIHDHDPKCNSSALPVLHPKISIREVTVLTSTPSRHDQPLGTIINPLSTAWWFQPFQPL